MHDQYYREMAEVADFQSGCDFECETDTLVCAAQEQAIRTNYIRISQLNRLYVDYVWKRVKVLIMF